MITKLSQNEDFTIVTKGGGAIIVPNVVTEPQFNSTTAYAVNAKVWYDSIQYVCITATTEPAEGQTNPTPKEDAVHWTVLPVEEIAKTSAIEPLLFAQYYPDGSVKSSLEWTTGLKYSYDEVAMTAAVLPFCSTGTATNDNSDLVGRVVIPPYVVKDGVRYQVTSVAQGVENPSANSGLTAIIAPSTVVVISVNAIRRCTGLVSISFPGEVSVGSGAFYGCTSLSEVSLPLAHTMAGYVFNGCTALTKMDLPSCTKITGGNVFENCPKLEKVNLPVFETKIGGKCFNGCTKLGVVNFGSIQREQIPALDNVNAFNVVPKSCIIIVPDANYEAWTTANRWIDIIAAGYKFLKHSEWEYARKYELDGKLDKSDGEMNGTLAVKVPDESGLPVFEINPGDPLQPVLPVMKFGDSGGVVHLHWRIAGTSDGHYNVIMEASNELGETRQICLPFTAGTLALAAEAGHAGDIAMLDANGNPIDSETAVSSIITYNDLAYSFDRNNTNYDPDDIVEYGNRFWICTLKYTATESSPTPDNDHTHWRDTMPCDVMTLLARTKLNQEAVENEFSELSTYAQKDYATHDGRLYRCKNTNGPGQWDPLYWENVKIKDLLDDKLGKTDTITRIANDNNTEHCDGSGNVYSVTKSGNTWYVPNYGGNQTYYGIFDGKYAWTHGGSFMTTYDPTTGIVKLYSGTTFQIPKNLNPLNGDDLSVDDENIIFTPLQATESSAPKTKFVRFPVYNGQNQQYFDDTATDEDDPTKTYKDTGTHRWTATANCIAYFNMQGSPNQSVVRIVVNDKSEVDSTTVFTHTVYRNLNLANKCVCVPLFLNANDKVYVKIADNALASLTISVFYI